MEKTQPPQFPKSHGTPFLRIVALLVFALLIAVISSVGTYLYISNQTVTQNQQQVPLLTLTITQTPINKGSGGCVKAGCSGQLCVEESKKGVITTCEFKDEYQCYKSAQCERQPNGKCGFTQTTKLKSCLEKGGGCPAGYYDYGMPLGCVPTTYQCKKGEFCPK